jgi:hypothetical protein
MEMRSRGSESSRVCRVKRIFYLFCTCSLLRHRGHRQSSKANNSQSWSPAVQRQQSEGANIGANNETRGRELVPGAAPGAPGSPGAGRAPAARSPLDASSSSTIHHHDDDLSFVSSSRLPHDAQLMKRKQDDAN